MKRLVSIIVIGGLLLSLCSCDKKDQDRSSQTDDETEVEETTESESESESEPETSETTESESVTTETSETTITEETTTLESEATTETENVEKKSGDIFIDCSGKSVDQIVDNISAIRSVGAGVTPESYMDRFDIAPQGGSDFEDPSFLVEFCWFSDELGLNDLFGQIGISADFDPDSGEIIVDGYSYAGVTLYLTDLDTAKGVYEKVSYILATEYADEVYNGDVDINELMEDDRSETEWQASYSARYVTLDLVRNDQGAYKVSFLIDLVS